MMAIVVSSTLFSFRLQPLKNGLKKVNTPNNRLESFGLLKLPISSELPESIIFKSNTASRWASWHLKTAARVTGSQ